jgi:hypothetical protein
LRGVSKDGREHGACGHPSRLAEDDEHLRMTAVLAGDLSIWQGLTCAHDEK